MLFLSPAKKSYLGVDLGTGSIKIVELSNYKNRARLETYGYIDMVSDILRSNTTSARKQIANAIKQLVQKSKVKTNKCVAALPTFSVFNSIISLPYLSKKDLAQAIRWEAKKYVPLPIEEMILDWKILAEDKQDLTNHEIKTDLPEGLDQPLENKASDKTTLGNILKQKNSNKFIKVLLTAAPKSLVSRYLEIFKEADLKLLCLETEAFALARCLIGHDQSTLMIVDIGATTTDICIIEKGLPIINRSLDTAGSAITNSIASSLNINLDRAEQFKRDYGVNLTENISSDGVSKIIAESLNPVINEVKYVFDIYQKQADNKIEKIILAGGSVFLPNLTDYLAKIFGIKVIIGNAWDRVIYPLDLKPVLEEVGSRLTVAIGLAMREIS